MSDIKIPVSGIKLTAGAIPIVVAVEDNPVVANQNIEIVVGLSAAPITGVAVTLSCYPDELEGMGSFIQRHQSQTYSAIVRKDSTEPFIVTATTPSGSLSSESVVVLSSDAVVDL